MKDRLEGTLALICKDCVTRLEFRTESRQGTVKDEGLLTPKFLHPPVLPRRAFKWLMLRDVY